MSNGLHDFGPNALLTVSEVAKALRVSTHWVRVELDKGDAGAFANAFRLSVRGPWRVPVSDVLGIRTRQRIPASREADTSATSQPTG